MDHLNNPTPRHPISWAMGLVAAPLLEWHAANPGRGLEPFNAAMTLIVLVLVLSPLTRFEMSFRVFNTVHAPTPNSQDRAYQYSKRHPGMAYFPWNPLSTLMGEGKFYHFAYGMFDRDLANYPISRDHFRRNFPANARYVCFHSVYHQHVNALKARAMMYLPEFKRQCRDRRTSRMDLL